MDEAEITAVAQAITDAHAKKPGMDCSGRIDDAKTIIAAIDALTMHRNSERAWNAEMAQPLSAAAPPSYTHEQNFVDAATGTVGDGDGDTDPKPEPKKRAKK